MVQVTEATAHNGATEIYWISEGPDSAETVLLINGGGSSSPMWCRELIDPLLDAGYRVIRFDNRDVGRSTRSAKGARYSVDDMASDAVAVLDAANAHSAHLFGRSMGGIIAQALSLEHPARVASLTLLYTTPGLSDAELPTSHPSVAEHAQELLRRSSPNPTREERIALRVDGNRFYTGTRYPYDEAWSCAEAEAEADHAPHATPPHGVVVRQYPTMRPRLHEIAMPTLVIHGDADPIVPVEHGRKLAELIPDCTYLELAGLSHELPPALCIELVPSLLGHYAAANH